MRAFSFITSVFLATLAVAAPIENVPRDLSGSAALAVRADGQNPVIQKMISCGVKREDIDGLSPIADQIKENVTTDGLETLSNILGHVATSVGSGPLAAVQIAIGVATELTRDVKITPKNIKQLVSFVGDNLENLPCLVKDN